MTFIHDDGTERGSAPTEGTLADGRTVSGIQPDGEGTFKIGQHYDGENIVKADGPEVAQGWVLEALADLGGGYGSGGLVAAFNDDTLLFGSAVKVGGEPAGAVPQLVAGTRYRVSVRWDRTGGECTMWINGSVFGSTAIDDMTPWDFESRSGAAASDPLGSLAANRKAWIGRGVVFHNVVFHRPGGDAFDDPAALHAALLVA